MFKRINLWALVAIVLFGLLEAAVVPNIKDGRIVGGIETDIERLPYQVSVRLDTYTLLHICGGAIYSHRVVVTAAHCIKGRFASYIRIVPGKSTITDDDPGFRVTKLIAHAAYNKATHTNDVGLIILADSLEYSSTIQPIPLAMHKPNAGDVATVSGWGKTDEDAATLTSNLQMVELHIVDLDLCNAQYATKSLAISDEMLCAGAEDGTKDSCQGDSGGPLVVNGELSGIVSWGLGCAREGYPGVYASVPYYTQWIMDNAKPYL